MPEGVVEPLLEEYKELFAYAKANTIIPLQLPPVFLAIAGALAIYLKELPPLFGLGVALVLFVLLIWLGYSHSLINGIGLRLVELEQKMNQRWRRTEQDGFSFHSDYIGRPERLPGFNVYSVLLFIVSAAVLSGSLLHFWSTMTHWQWGTYAKIVGVTLPAAFNIAAVVNMAYAEQKTRRLRDELLVRYRGSK